MNNIKKILLGVIVAVISATLFSCKPSKVDDPIVEGHKTTPYNLVLPFGFPPMPIPADNPLTVEGVELGRMLFYDPILSGNNTQSCGSCHNAVFAFTDDQKQFSQGITGALGNRNSMPVFNLGWGSKFFWDGGAKDLESQVIGPIMNPLEMNANLADVIAKLRNHPKYPELFKKAFGTDSVTTQRLMRAVAQFMRIIISGNTNFDFRRMTDDEARGYEIFLDLDKGDCIHCHVNSPLFTDADFKNNGLDPTHDADPGRYTITGNINDKGKFKTPSLRNLIYTAPYMHDGRFNTLEEVVEFYDTGFHYSPSLDINLEKHLDANKKPKSRMSNQEKKDLVSFLKSLNDTVFIKKPEYQSPF